MFSKYSFATSCFIDTDTMYSPTTILRLCCLFVFVVALDNRNVAIMLPLNVTCLCEWVKDLWVVDCVDCGVMVVLFIASPSPEMNDYLRYVHAIFI